MSAWVRQHDVEIDMGWDDFRVQRIGWTHPKASGLAVTSNHRRGHWSITHLRSGRRLFWETLGANEWPLATAQRIMLAVAPLYDWTRSRRAILHNRRQIMRAVRRVVKSASVGEADRA